MSVDPYYPPSAWEGYTCALCGGWVPYGASHFCHGYLAPPEPTTIKWDRTSDVRIADALERIAVALENLASPAPEETLYLGAPGPTVTIRRDEGTPTNTPLTPDNHPGGAPEETTWGPDHPSYDEMGQ